MLSQLITLPLRIGARAAHLSLSTAEEALRVTASLAGQLIHTVRPGESAADEFAARPRPEERGPTAATEPRPDTPNRPSPPVTSPAYEPSRVPAPAADEPAEPAHVSREPRLVEELAEPGAEEGAGAQIRVDEPWPGYQRMAAKDVVARLGEATPAELAAVELYERTHRARQTVLTAAERRLRLHTAGTGGSQT